MILSVVYDLLGESALAAAGLEKLKAAMARFATNRQIYPLVYECEYIRDDFNSPVLHTTVLTL